MSVTGGDEMVNKCLLTQEYLNGEGGDVRLTLVTLFEAASTHAEIVDLVWAYRALIDDDAMEAPFFTAEAVARTAVYAEVLTLYFQHAQRVLGRTPYPIEVDEIETGFCSPRLERLKPERLERGRQVLLSLRKGGSEQMEKWYVGAMNDAYFVIDAPPRPSTDYITEQVGVNVIMALGTNGKAAELIVTEHNARLSTPSHTAQLARLRAAAALLAIPYEALLLDSESRKWIAPEVWSAIENGVATLRAALAEEGE